MKIFSQLYYKLYHLTIQPGLLQDSFLCRNNLVSSGIFKFKAALSIFISTIHGPRSNLWPESRDLIAEAVSFLQKFFDCWYRESSAEKQSSKCH